MRIALLALLAVLRIFLTQKSPDGAVKTLSGQIITEPRDYGAQELLKLNGYSFFVPTSEGIDYGSYVVVTGVVDNKSLKRVKVIENVAPQGILQNAKSKILNSIKDSLPEPESSLLAGVTLGDPNIPKNFLANLRKTGTAHVVVASGGNLVILGSVLEKILSRYMKRKKFLVVIFTVLLIYSALTGFEPPIVRALIMWSAVFVAQIFGRKVNRINVLLATASLMLTFSPRLFSDVSFWLSVSATFGIVVFTPVLEKKIKNGLIRESIVPSLAAQLGVFPVSAYFFGNVSLLGPLWNALVIWTVPYITILGLVGALITLLVEPIGKLIIFIGYPLLHYFVEIVSLSS